MKILVRTPNHNGTGPKYQEVELIEFIAGGAIVRFAGGLEFHFDIERLFEMPEFKQLTYPIDAPES